MTLLECPQRSRYPLAPLALAARPPAATGHCLPTRVPTHHLLHHRLHILGSKRCVPADPIQLRRHQLSHVRGRYISPPRLRLRLCFILAKDVSEQCAHKRVYLEGAHLSSGFRRWWRRRRRRRQCRGGGCRCRWACCIRFGRASGRRRPSIVHPIPLQSKPGSGRGRRSGRCGSRCTCRGACRGVCRCRRGGRRPARERSGGRSRGCWCSQRDNIGSRCPALPPLLGGRLRCGGWRKLRSWPGPSRIDGLRLWWRLLRSADARWCCSLHGHLTARAA